MKFNSSLFCTEKESKIYNVSFELLINQFLLFSKEFVRRKELENYFD